MKFQDLFSLKNNFFFFYCRLLQILLGALRVNIVPSNSIYFHGEIHVHVSVGTICLW